jgi:hypothetical protein
MFSLAACFQKLMLLSHDIKFHTYKTTGKVFVVCTEWTGMWVMSNNCVTKIKRPLEIKLTPLEWEFQIIFVACGINDVILTMAARCASVDIAVKWRLKRRRRIDFAHGGCVCGTPSEIAVEQWSRVLWYGTGTHRKLARMGRHFAVMSTVALLVADGGNTWLKLHGTKFVSSHSSGLCLFVFVK